MYVEKINKVRPHILALINCKLRYSTKNKKKRKSIRN